MADIVRVPVTTVKGVRIPEGQLGLPGRSAYAVAVSLGFDGTEEEWLASLHGEGADEATIAAAVADYLTAHPAAPLVHTHTEDQVVGLVADLAGKSDVGHTHAEADVTGLTESLAAKSDVGHTHPESDVVGLVSALAGKAAVAHTHTSASITDFVEAVQDAVAGFFTAGANISVVYDDAGNTLTVSTTGSSSGDAELIQDAIGAALQGVGNISVLYDDTANTITVATTATVNSTDAALRDRSTHTGTQSADTIVDSGSFKVMTAAERTKLAGVAPGATANDTDANLKNRANHTGTQTASTISDFAAAADARVAAGITGKLDASAAPELIRDTMGIALVAGSGVIITVNDAGDTITIDSLAIAAGSADNPHTSKTDARNNALPKNWWRYTGTAPTDNPTNWLAGDEWISA